MIRFALVVAVCFTSSLAQARFAWRPKNVPADRLVKNVTEVLSKDPKNAQAHYVLGRIHSMAYAFGEQIQTGTPFRGQPGKFPLFAPWLSVRAKPNAKLEFNAHRAWHLAASIAHYKKAVELGQKQLAGKDKGKPDQRVVARAALGLGWMYEQAAKHEKAIKKLDRSKLTDAQKKVMKEQFVDIDDGKHAIGAYQKVVKIIGVVDKMRRFNGPGGDSLMSLDAAKAILALYGDKKFEGRDNLEAHVAAFKNLRRVVTPIVFSLKPSKSVNDLLAKGKTARFDLDGDGQKRTWPWVRSETCFLVWDPKAAGKITSGRQMFGSVTWWILWDDGYQAMRSLDDNGDGWLKGAELTGLAVWQDKNGNGVSDRGEVTPLSRLPIRRLSVRVGSRMKNGAPMNRLGVELNNGTRLPSYDWTPQEIR